MAKFIRRIIRKIRHFIYNVQVTIRFIKKEGIRESIRSFILFYKYRKALH